MRKPISGIAKLTVWSARWPELPSVLEIMGPFGRTSPVSRLRSSWRASAAIVGRGHQMSAWPEVAVDHVMRRGEPPRLGRRLEALHLPFPSSGQPVRVLSTIVRVSAPSVPDLRQQSAMRDAVAAQTVGDQPPRLVLQPPQQPLEEALRRRCISSIMNQDVEHDAMLADRPPEIVQHAMAG
jgi:hypothetical protein